MWVYQKTLQHPVNIKNMDLKMAKYLITQFGGPNGELAASLRYLSQRQPGGPARLFRLLLYRSPSGLR